MELKKILLCFYFAVVEIIYCFSEISERMEREVRIGDFNGSSLFPQSTRSDELRDVTSAGVTDDTFNPCLVEGSRDKVNNDISPGNHRRKYYSADDGHLKDKEDTPEDPLLSNDTFLGLSDHFLHCTHIGMEPGEFEFLSTRCIYVPRLSKTFQKSDFYQHETGVVFICDDYIGRGDENSTNSTTGEVDMSAFAHLSDEFLNCSGHTSVEKEHFEYRPNRTVYVPRYDKTFDYSNYLIGAKGQLFICPVFFHKETKFAESFEIVTVLGLSVSIVFIVFYMIFFAFMEPLRNLPGYCLFSLCVALLTAYFCFLLRSIGPTTDQCRDLVMLIMYFFLAAFFWMNVLSFDVWRSLKMATSKLRLSGNSMLWKRFALYSLYAWLSPLCIITFGLLVTKYNSSMEFLHIEIEPTLCWFAKKGALFVYLALPLVILMCLNVIFFTTSFIMITNASLNTSENMATFWKRFFLFLRLAVIMGVAWIFGIIAAATNQPALFYIFVILNTLQGVFIFFSFALSEKTKKALKKKLMLRKSSAVFPSQVTSQPAQSMTSV